MFNLQLLHLFLLFSSIYACITEATKPWDSAENDQPSPVVNVARALFHMWGLEPGVVQNICLHCDPRCQASCGSRKFRRCCYHFMRRKRSSGGLNEHNDGNNNGEDRYRKVPSIKQLVDLWQSQQQP